MRAEEMPVAFLRDRQRCGSTPIRIVHASKPLAQNRLDRSAVRGPVVIDHADVMRTGPRDNERSERAILRTDEGAVDFGREIILQAAARLRDINESLSRLAVPGAMRVARA